MHAHKHRSKMNHTSQNTHQKHGYDDCYSFLHKNLGASNAKLGYYYY